MDANDQAQADVVARPMLAAMMAVLSILIALSTWRVQEWLMEHWLDRGTALPYLTGLSCNPIFHLVPLVILAGCSLLLAIRELALIGLVAWVVVLLGYATLCAVCWMLPRIVTP